MMGVARCRASMPTPDAGHHVGEGEHHDVGVGRRKGHRDGGAREEGAGGRLPKVRRLRAGRHWGAVMVTGLP